MGIIITFFNYYCDEGSASASASALALEPWPASALALEPWLASASAWASAWP